MLSTCQKAKAMHEAKILKIVMSSPVLEVARETGFEPTELMKFYLDLENLMKSHIPYGEIGDKFRFLLNLTTDDSKGELNIFDKDAFVPAIKNGILDKGNILTVNSNGEVINQIEGILIDDYVQAAEYSRDNQLITFFIDCRAVHFIVNGTPKYHIYDMQEYSHPGVRTPRTLSAREYRQLINRHYVEEVYGEKGVKYWRNKEDRILLDNPEIIFHGPLWSYLDQYLVDGTPDREATIGGTTDRTDIRITDWTNKARYIIEIKCLGRTSLNKPEKSDDWANAGLDQLNLYLKEEEKSTCLGTLVLYDGRMEDKKIKWCAGIDCHPSYDNNPMRFYLESESASVKAKRIVRNLKRKSRE
jgi:hypothetical protein